MPCVGLQCVIVAFPGQSMMILNNVLILNGDPDLKLPSVGPHGFGGSGEKGYYFQGAWEHWKLV